MTVSSNEKNTYWLLKSFSCFCKSLNIKLIFNKKKYNKVQPVNSRSLNSKIYKLEVCHSYVCVVFDVIVSLSSKYMAVVIGDPSLSLV